MVAIGGKGKQKKERMPSQPQVVVQRAAGVNDYAKIGRDDRGDATITWTGDPRMATRFNSRYEAKNRTREYEDIPETRVFKFLETKVSA